MDKCQAPFTGFTIAPSGHITFCCMGDNKLRQIGLLSEVDDLQEFFLKSERLNEVRTQMLEGNFKQISPCSKCYTKHTDYGFKDVINEQFPFDVPVTHVRYLEITTSNLCNATCAMCDANYSSAWIKYDHLFPKEIFSYRRVETPSIKKISDDDVEKIKKILPNLEWFMIKGGEPFADPNNFKILKNLVEVNNRCKINFVTNMSILRDDHIEILKQIPSRRLNISVSIDGVGEVYNWIRSTNFETVVSNMEKLYRETGVKFNISTCLTIYNFFNIESVIEYFADKEYIRSISLNNISYNPPDTSVMCLPKSIMETRCIEIVEKLKGHAKVFGTEFILDLLDREKYSSETRKLSIERTERINSMRGFSIFDHVPELKNALLDNT